MYAIRSYYDGGANGNMYTKLTMELRYPLALNPSATVFALSFVEAGNAWSEFDQFNPFELRRSAGVGLRIVITSYSIHYTKLYEVETELFSNQCLMFVIQVFPL